MHRPQGDDVFATHGIESCQYETHDVICTLHILYKSDFLLRFLLREAFPRVQQSKLPRPFC